MAKESPGESELRDQLAQAATPAERCDVLLAAADAASDRNAPHWEELLRVALAEAQSLDDPDRVCRVCVKLCNYFARLGRGVDTDRTLGLFADAASRTQDRRLKGSCAYVKAGRLHDLDQYQQAEPFVAECIEHWTVIGYTAGLSAIHDLVGSAALMRGQPAEALRSYQQSLEYVPAGDLYGRAIANCNIAGALQQMGRWEDAVESAYHGLALAEQGGLPEQRAQALELLGEVFLRRDRLPKAIDLFSQVIRIHGETGLAGDQARDSGLALAEAYLRQGDLSRAEQVLTEHESLILADARPYCRARLFTARAEVALAEGRVPDAEALARESAELAAGHGLVSEQAEALRVLARARAAAGNGTAAREGLEQAAALLGAREDSFELARVRMQHGLLLVDTGDTAAGRELLQAAGRTFRRLSATAESGQVSRALFGLDLAADSELALLQGVTGLVALGLDPQVFVTRAIELLLAGLRFSSGTLLVGRRPVVVVGTPNLEEARLAADAAETVRTPLALVLPVPYQGRSLGVLYLDRPEPVEGGRQLMILDTLATLLAPMVQRVAEITASAADAAAQTAALAGLHYTGVVGSSPAMRDVLAVVARVAGTSVPVLIRGESGTGKELVARALHESSPRAGGPFVAVNCAALPESLMEAEFFGVEKGAATGVAARKGRFEQAHKGTIFLDEIGEMSPNLQAKLLRVLAERTLDRVGGRQSIAVDVRIVSATNSDIGSLLQGGGFRHDLYYRLNTVEVALPALRDRREDIPALVSYFIRRADEEFGRSVAQCEPAALDALCRYDWPGNIRELQHAVERAVLLAESGTIVERSLPPNLHSPRPVPGRASAADVRQSAVDPAERALILQCLERSGWQVNRAAELAGYSRAQFYRLMRNHGITRPKR